MFTLIDLPYTSLAPVISDQTLAFHHGKHLQTYVDNLNKLIAGTEFEGKSLEEIVKASTGGVFNNAGQILNHELYFSQFKAASSVMPDLIGHLKSQIAKQWGTLDAFKAEFESKGTTLFGSGWVWLQADDKGELSIAQYTNADNPVAHGFKPILTFDVWEHAYYLDWQNQRAAYAKAVVEKHLDWTSASRRFAAEGVTRIFCKGHAAMLTTCRRFRSR